MHSERVIPWRYIRIVIPDSNDPYSRWDGPWPMYERDVCQALVRHFARSLGIPWRGRAVARRYTCLTAAYVGYVRIYRGEPTEEDKALWTKAKCMAQHLVGFKVWYPQEKYHEQP